MKKIWTIIGLGVAVGTAAYVIWDKTSKSENDILKSPVAKTTQNVEESTIQPSDALNAEVNIDEVRTSVAKTVSERHEEAAQIMKNAVDVIYQRSEVSEEETAELDRISRELDNLLNEE